MKLLAALAVALSLVAGPVLADGAKGSDKPASAEKDDKGVKEQKAEKPAKEAGVSTVPGAEPSGNTHLVEIVEISGEIGNHTVEQMARTVRAINENKRVKSVVLVLNSPGGGASASSAAYEELSKIKVPVVVWCDQVCASGAYYIAMSPAVKFLGVRTETVTGSVGVIAQVTRFNRLLEWAKVDNETYVSGSLKDASNPKRAKREDEAKYLQSIVDGLAKRFYGVVKKARNVKNWDEVKTGRIFFGDNAVKNGLADGILDRDGAIAKAKKLAGVKTIFTREEIEKMSKEVAQGAVLKAPAVQPTMQTDIHELVELLNEVRGGKSTRFAYILPYRF